MRRDAAQLVIADVSHAMQTRTAGNRELMVAWLEAHACAGLSWERCGL